MHSILVVDDIEKLCKIICKDFALIGYNTFFATTAEEGIKIFKQEKISLVLLDLKLGNANGLDILRKMKKIKRQIPIIMVTGHGTISNAVEAIKSGAHDYITKPVDFEKLKKMVKHAIHLETLKEENEQLKDLLNGRNNNTLLTINDNMLSLLDKLKKFASTDYPVFIEGESGTGKELVAEFLHHNSKRKAKEFFKVNCAAFSESLLDDELFGHNKGAFTGAASDFKGIFERANGSSLFLDEIGDLPLQIQSKVLRTFQNHEIRRLGGDRNILVDIRFIAATNRPIKKLVDEGLFREDLFFRLNTAMIKIPPLRERKNDIPLLSHHFLKEGTKKNGCENMDFDPKVLNFFLDYHWPGNVRELINVINYASTISMSGTIVLDDLPQYMLRDTNRRILIRSEIEKDEREQILAVLESCNHNKSQAAKVLGVSRRTLYNKLEKYGLIC
jgi:DNA-binding NtrC family response regulator